jgi:hypothetical protein
VALTDAEGRYRFTDLPAGRRYAVRASKNGLAARGYGEGPPSRPPTAIILTEGQQLTPIDISLTEQIPISGVVLDEDDSPFSGALVEAMRPVFSNGRRTMVTVAEAITSNRGEFRLDTLPPGQYYLSAFDPAFANVGDANGALFYSPTFYSGGVFPDEATRLTIDQDHASEQLSFALRIIRPSRVTGSLETQASPTRTSVPLLSAAVVMSP